MVSVLLLTGALLFAFSTTLLAAKNHKPQEISPDSENLPLLKSIESSYAGIIQAVEVGKASREMGELASDLWVSLQHYLIDSNDLMRRLKFEIKHSRGVTQDEAIDRLISATGDRERTLMAYFQRFSGLAGGSEELPLPPRSPPEKDAGQGQVKPAGAMKGAGHEIRIEFNAEDLTKTKME